MGKMPLILILFIQLSSCSLKEEPELYLTDILSVGQDFRLGLLQTRPDLEAVELEYQSVKGKTVPVIGLRWWRGVHRSFFFPRDTAKSQGQGFSLHTLVMYNRREALKLFQSFCQDEHWQGLQVLTPRAQVYLYRNAVIHLNIEPKVSELEIQTLHQSLEKRILLAKGSKTCLCKEKTTY
jgi:hypothetical protein